MAVGSGPGGGSYLYLGDIGDNAARQGGTPRTEIQVYRAPEPEFRPPSPRPRRPSRMGGSSIHLPRPGSRRGNADVDPVTGDLLMVTKESDGTAVVFAQARPRLPIPRRCSSTWLPSRSEPRAAKLAGVGRRHLAHRRSIPLEDLCKRPHLAARSVLGRDVCGRAPQSEFQHRAQVKESPSRQTAQLGFPQASKRVPSIRQ